MQMNSLLKISESKGTQSLSLRHVIMASFLGGIFKYEAGTWKPEKLELELIYGFVHCAKV